MDLSVTTVSAKLIIIHSRTLGLRPQGIVRFGPVGTSRFCPQKGPRRGEKYMALISYLSPHFAPNVGLWYQQFCLVLLDKVDVEVFLK